MGTFTRSHDPQGVAGESGKGLGMASIESRPNGTVRVKWRFDGKQESVTVDSPKDARMLTAWLNRNGVCPAMDPDLLFALGRQVPRTMADVVTVGDAFDAMIAKPHLAAGSRRRYEANKRHLADLMDRSIATLTRADVDAVMEPLQARYSEATWKSVGSALSSAIRPHGQGDLCIGYRGRSTDRERDTVVMTKATMDLLVAIGSDHGVGDLLMILTDTGMRFGEAAAMDREHCELIGETPTYRVRRQFPAVAWPKGTTPEPVALKSKRGRRDLPLSPRLVELAERTPSGLLTVDGYLGRGPWRHKIAARRLDSVSRDAIAEGLISRPVTFHDFRHSWGAHLLTNGVDIVTVSRLMGHSSVKVTGDVYGHLTAQGLDAVRSLLK